MRFVTDFVPGDEQREQVLRRHFGMLPRSARRESVLCLGQMTLCWRGLGRGGEADGGLEDGGGAALVAARDEHEGYAGDKSDYESSGDEQHELRNSMRSILPKLANVAMPTPRREDFSVEDLMARGGRVMEEGEGMAAEDDWL